MAKPEPPKCTDCLPVTADNFPRAETDLYFDEAVKLAGGIGQFHHYREVMPIDKQTVIPAQLLKSYKFGADGSLTLYVSHDNTSPAKQPNWLPAPDGPFYAVLRVYLPGDDVLNGTWKRPQLQPVSP